MIAVLIVFHAANEKKRKKTTLKQDSKSRKEYKNVVVVANFPGSLSLHCRTAIALLSLCCLSGVAPLSYRYHYAVALLSLHCRTSIAPLSLHCRSAAIASDFATQLHRYHTTIDPLSLPAVAHAVAMQLLLIFPPLSLRCHAAVASLLLRYRSAVVPLSLCPHFCLSVAAAVTPGVATVSLLLSLLLSLTVVASRGRIKVTVFISDCQARVSSSSEGCSTSHKTVKLEAY